MSSTSEAGPELDSRIANLIGLTGGLVIGSALMFDPRDLRDFFRGKRTGDEGGIGPEGRFATWSPSFSVDDALEAAEKRGLLAGSEFFMHRDDDAWEVGMLYRTIDPGRADSLSLAICRFIENFKDTRA